MKWYFGILKWLPESPRFDIARGQPEQALETLKRIADDNGKPMPLGRIVEVTNDVRIILRMIVKFKIIIMLHGVQKISFFVHGK